MKIWLTLIGCFVNCTSANAVVIYVDANAAGRNNGTNWSDSIASLQAAIDTAVSGDEIWVTEGTYEPITLKDGVKIFGGFGGKETLVSESDPETRRTYISGGGVSRSVISIDNGPSTLLQGSYIVDGFIEAPEMGGGLYLKNSDVVVSRCVFTRNRSVAWGGAVGIKSGSPSFTNCKFQGNDGGWAAGAVFARNAGSAKFVNCLFADNRAMEAGAVSLVEGAPEFTNCTFSANQATKGKGGAMFDGRGTATLRNCVVWGNTAAVSGSHELYNAAVNGGVTTITHSDVRGGWPGAGNIAADPTFVDAARGDYRLDAGSPCLDAGRDQDIPAAAANRDLAGSARNIGASVDMGAYERGP